ncbi:Type 1 glutamine amidotransferase-like domain-containing protein [Microbacterium sp. C7(2022)]|uniref:Type 1 glutamine amidotransferase-like domain-containing protein n=1 Tax=Microbacterium sp. C7(2022) TaxID=2992759 RepID=UPI00237ACE36|nr:Type 1 glutamine amidotransferase-like domain-containing protein [Microbacterium sp. C7(2022)]MDE0547449.1 peptidase E [Microbacterium sp. C7(2022)]
MRMLLTSNGIANDLIRDTLVDLLGKPLSESRVVVVIDAILGFPGDSSMLVTHLEGLRALGWAEFDVASLFAGPQALVESRLRSADVILGYGGSNLWAAHTWHATGLAPVLAELLEEKVYVGWSAGSMIFARRLDRWPADFNDQDELEMFGLEDAAPAVALFDWFFAGHLGADWMPAHAEQNLSQGARRSGQDVWFVDDDTALLIRDPAAEPTVISSGHWRRYGPDGSLIASA